MESFADEQYEPTIDVASPSFSFMVIVGFTVLASRRPIADPDEENRGHYFGIIRGRSRRASFQQKTESRRDNRFALLLLLAMSVPMFAQTPNYTQRNFFAPNCANSTV